MPLLLSWSLLTSAEAVTAADAEENHRKDSPGATLARKLVSEVHCDALAVVDPNLIPNDALDSEPNIPLMPRRMVMEVLAVGAWFERIRVETLGASVVNAKEREDNRPVARDSVIGRKSPLPPIGFNAKLVDDIQRCAIEEDTPRPLILGDAAPPLLQPPMKLLLFPVECGGPPMPTPMTLALNDPVVGRFQPRTTPPLAPPT